jgi:hypothetical protein
MRVMHCIAVKFCTVLRRMFTARGQMPVVALAKVKVMIDMPIEMLRPVEPGSRADKYTT